MDFSPSAQQVAWRDRVRAFVEDRVRPAAADYEIERRSGDRFKVLSVVEGLKAAARDAGLWNLFMPPVHEESAGGTGFSFDGPGLSNVTYAICAEEMGRIEWASEVFNCSAPDTGNMEVLLRYGTRAQQERWLTPLMNGEIRSAFLMTEPGIASSDATNIETQIRRDGGDYVIDGRKWWSSGVGDPRCRLAIVMGKTDPSAPRHRQQAMILVPMDTPGVRIDRLLTVFGYDHAPHGHGEVGLRGVRVPADNVVLGPGRGFEIAQGRLGPGRIHHCMRAIGAAEEALGKMVRRLLDRAPFGVRLADQSVWQERVAQARLDIDMTRLLCLKAADIMDRLGNKAAAGEIAMTKVAAPRMALRILDDAIQAFGGAGVGDDDGLAESWAYLRTLRLADGPDEVHVRTIARLEYARHQPKPPDHAPEG